MARNTRSGRLADRSIKVALSKPRMIGRGFRPYERYELSLASNGNRAKVTRDVLRVGKVVALMPFDPKRNEIILLRQFRLPAHLANGRGDLVEIVAGHVEDGETAAQAARRECMEEIGLKPSRLIKLMTYMTTPGLCDEEMTIFLGLVDASAVPTRGGAAAENEATYPFTVSIDDALRALDDGKLRNGPLITALQWLALYHDRLQDIVSTRAAKS